MSGKSGIPASQCKEGYTYRIHSRNLTVGVFRKVHFGDRFENGFIGIREKCGDLFLFTEYHRDDGAPYGTVSPESEIEKCPIGTLEETLGTECSSCGKKVAYKIGVTIKTEEKWAHLEETPCQKASPVSIENKKLFDYLRELEFKLYGPHLCWRCRDGDHEHHVTGWRAGACECVLCKEKKDE